MVPQRLGVSRVQVSRFLNGRSSISADMAIRIGLLTHTTPESWLAGQTKWDLWQASQKPRPMRMRWQLSARSGRFGLTWEAILTQTRRNVYWVDSPCSWARS